VEECQEAEVHTEDIAERDAEEKDESKAISCGRDQPGMVEISLECV
jgi:hypothetical protein